MKLEILKIDATNMHSMHVPIADLDLQLLKACLMIVSGLQWKTSSYVTTVWLNTNSHWTDVIMEKPYAAAIADRKWKYMKGKKN